MHQIAGQYRLSYRLTSLIISFRHITCHATYSYTDPHCHLALHLLLRVLSAISSSAMHFDRLSSHSFRQPYDNWPRLMSRSTTKSAHLLDQSVSAPYSGLNEHKSHTNKIVHAHIAMFQQRGFAYAPIRKLYTTWRHVYAFPGETRSVRWHMPISIFVLLAISPRLSSWSEKWSEKTDWESPHACCLLQCREHLFL